MSDNTIRISYARARFAAELLAGCRSSLLRVTDLLAFELDAASSARRQAGDRRAPFEPVDTSALVAAALYAEWIADTLRRQVAFYSQLDSKLAATFDAPEVPNTELVAQAPPEWPQPPLPGPLADAPNPVAGNAAPLGSVTLRDQIVVRMQDIVHDLDDALGAINYSGRIRFQAEISDATTRLRRWAASSAAGLDGP